MASAQTQNSVFSVNMNDIMDNVHIIAEKFNPDKVILFGSYAMDNPTRDSDVDLFVIMNPVTSSWQTSVAISSALKHHFPMDIIVRSPEEVENRLKLGDFFIKDIIENGKVLFERVS